MVECAGPLQGLHIFLVKDVAHFKSQNGYERVDLHLAYNAVPDWDFPLQIRNLLDEKYVERFRDSFQDNFFGSPRAVLFRAKKKFGAAVVQ